MITTLPKAWETFDKQMRESKEAQRESDIFWRNRQRNEDVSQICSLLDAVSDKPEFIEAIPFSATEICRSDATDCTGLIDLGAIIDWPNMPYDKFSNNKRSTRYTIHRSKLQKPVFGGLKRYTFTVTSLDAENGEIISETY